MNAREFIALYKTAISNDEQFDMVATNVIQNAWLGGVRVLEKMGADLTLKDESGRSYASLALLRYSPSMFRAFRDLGSRDRSPANTLNLLMWDGRHMAIAPAIGIHPIGGTREKTYAVLKEALRHPEYQAVLPDLVRGWGQISFQHPINDTPEVRYATRTGIILVDAGAQGMRGRLDKARRRTANFPEHAKKNALSVCDAIDRYVSEVGRGPVISARRKGWVAEEGVYDSLLGGRTPANQRRRRAPPTSRRVSCAGRTGAGARCSREAGVGGSVCWQHGG